MRIKLQAGLLAKHPLGHARQAQWPSLSLSPAAWEPPLRIIYRVSRSALAWQTFHASQEQQTNIIGYYGGVGAAAAQSGSHRCMRIKLQAGHGSPARFQSLL